MQTLPNYRCLQPAYYTCLCGVPRAKEKSCSISYAVYSCDSETWYFSIKLCQPHDSACVSLIDSTDYWAERGSETCLKWKEDQETCQLLISLK